MTLNLDAIPVMDLEIMLVSQTKLLEEENLKFRSLKIITEKDRQEYRIKRYAHSETILSIKRAIARKRSSEWIPVEKKLRLEAQQLIDSVHSGEKSDDEWLLLEADIDTFFRSLPQEMRVIAEEMFIRTGAAELIYMICSDIRYIRGNAT